MRRTPYAERAANRRRVALTVALCPGLILALIGQSSQAASTPSALIPRSFCEPSFTIDGKSQRSGTGFLMERVGGQRRTYLVTAQHLFSAPPADMPRRVPSASCLAPTEGKQFATGPAIAIPGAHPMGPLASLEDVAVFPVKGWSPGLPLATADAAPGDAVWLLARVKGGAETAQLLHRAIVGVSSGFLAYRFDDQSLNLDQTSGGAVVNSSGEVVAVNIGYTHLENGALIGIGDRLAVLKRAFASLP